MSAMQSEIDELKQRPSAAVSHHTNSVNSLIQEMGQLKLRVDHQGVAIDTIKRNITDLRLNIAFEEDLLDDLEDFDRKVSCRCYVRVELMCLTKMDSSELAPRKNHSINHDKS